MLTGFPGGSEVKASAWNAGDPGLIPSVGKIPWRKAWQPTPVFLPGESPWTEEPAGLQSIGWQKVKRLRDYILASVNLLTKYSEIFKCL